MAEFYSINHATNNISDVERAQRSKNAEGWTEFIGSGATQEIHGLDEPQEGKQQEGVTLTVNPGMYRYLGDQQDDNGQGKLFTYHPPTLSLLHGTPDVSESTVQQAMALAWKHAVDTTGHLTYSTSLSPFSVRAVKYARDRGLVVDPSESTNFDELYRSRFTREKEGAMDQLKGQYEEEYRKNSGYYNDDYDEDDDEYVDDCTCWADDCDYCDPRDEEGEYTGDGNCYDCPDCRYGDLIERERPTNDVENTYDPDEEQQYVADKMKGMDEQKASAVIFRKRREDTGYGAGATGLSTKTRYDAAQRKIAERAPQTILGRVDSPRQPDYDDVTVSRVSKATPEEVKDAVQRGLKHGLEHRKNLKAVRSIEDLQEEANTEYDARVAMDSDETNLFGEALNPRARAQSKADLPDNAITSPTWKIDESPQRWNRHTVAELELPPNGPQYLTNRIAIPTETVGSSLRNSNMRLKLNRQEELSSQDQAVQGVELDAQDLRDRISSSPGLTAALNAKYEDSRNTYESLFGDQDTGLRPQAGSRSAAFSTGTAESNEETANRSFFNK